MKYPEGALETNADVLSRINTIVRDEKQDLTEYMCMVEEKKKQILYEYVMHR
jgi:hypothetical protein